MLLISTDMQQKQQADMHANQYRANKKFHFHFTCLFLTFPQKMLLWYSKLSVSNIQYQQPSPNTRNGGGVLSFKFSSSFAFEHLITELNMKPY